MAVGERGEVTAEASASAASPITTSSATACNRNLIRAGLLAEARVADVVRPYGLSYSTFQVLTILNRADAQLSPCQISDRMVVPRNTLTHILDVLERQDLVRRERHPRHRGMVLVELTEKGRGVVGEILPNLHARDAEWWVSFSEDERRTLVALLLRAQDALAGPEGHPEHAEQHHRHQRQHQDVAEGEERSGRESDHAHPVSHLLRGTARWWKQSDAIDA